MATADSQETFADDQTRVCNLCLKNAGRYTCPRCNLRYCSAACYKGDAHSTCSEAFYKDCFMEGLKDMEASSDEKQKMQEMLRRLEEDDPRPLDSDEEDDEEEDLETRMQGLDLGKDTETIWERLTERERKEFQDMLQDGRLGNMVELWEPWWKTKRQSLVEEVSAPSPLSHPPIKKDIPAISSILKNASPSEQVPYILVNVLYAYVYVARLHNGDHLHNAEQASQEVQDIAGGLGALIFSSVSESIHGCLQCLYKQESSLLVSQQFSVAVIEDIRCILESDHPASPLKYTLAALSDIHHLLRLGRKALENDLKEAKNRNKASDISRLKVLRQKCFAASKKVEFLLSWAVKYGAALQECGPQLELEFCALSSELGGHTRDKKRFEKHWGGTHSRKAVQFIEDISER